MKSRSRSGFTLVETIAAIGVLAVLFILWRPLLNLVLQPLAYHDDQLLDMLQTDRDVNWVSKQATGQLVPKDADYKLRLKQGDKVWHIEKMSDGRAFRVTGLETGQMVLLQDVKKLQWTEVAPNRVHYLLTFFHDQPFEGTVTFIAPES